MSLLGTIESSGITSTLIFIWLQTICLNFIMAYPLQILVVGPFCRFIFCHLFASTNQGNESKVENENKFHKSMFRMLANFDDEDLIALERLVKKLAQAKE